MTSYRVNIKYSVNNMLTFNHYLFFACTLNFNLECIRKFTHPYSVLLLPWNSVVPMLPLAV